MAAIAAVAGPAALGISAAGVLLVGSVAGIIGAEVEAFKGLVSYYEENGTIDGSTKTVLDAASVGFRNATVGVAIDIGVGAAFSKLKTWGKGLPSKPIKGGTDVIETVSKTNPFDLQPTHSSTLSKNKMNALMDDIKVNGIQNPIKYVEYNGQMYVVDGHHRLLAAKRLGLTEVPIEKVDLPYAGYNTIDDLLWFE